MFAASVVDMQTPDPVITAVLGLYCSFIISEYGRKAMIGI